MLTTDSVRETLAHRSVETPAINESEEHGSLLDGELQLARSDRPAAYDAIGDVSGWPEKNEPLSMGLGTSLSLEESEEPLDPKAAPGATIGGFPTVVVVLKTTLKGSLWQTVVVRFAKKMVLSRNASLFDVVCDELVAHLHFSGKRVEILAIVV